MKDKSLNTSKDEKGFVKRKFPRGIDNLLLPHLRGHFPWKDARETLSLLGYLQINDILPVIEGEKQQHVIPEMTGDQEIILDMFAAIFANLPGIFRAGQKLLDGKSRPFCRITQ